MSDFFFALLAEGGTPAPAPSAAPFRLGASTHVLVDGNSYYARWVYDPINQIGPLDTFLRSRGVASSNTAVAGQTWTTMLKGLADVVAVFDPTKSNVLVCGETRNFVANVPRRPATGVPEDTVEAWSARALRTAISRSTSYIAAAQEAVRSRYGQGFDKVVLCGTIPNSTLGNEEWKDFVPEMNRVLLNFDEHARTHYREMGADAFADFRSNVQWFGGDGTTKPGFAQTQETVREKLDSGEWVHPTGAAREAFAEVIADALKRLEA